MSDARAIAEQTARASYGRLLAWLSSRARDVAAAEDALGEAFRAALETWPEAGAPTSPEAWLLTAARRKLIDGARRQNTRILSAPALSLAAEEAEAATRADKPFPDERLKLLFICAHPAIDAAIRTPLMLQTVLGLDAARIASAFLVSPRAMSARLVRAKRKIKVAAIPFDAPGGQDLAARLPAVLEAIYAAFGAGWDHEAGAEASQHDLTSEALYLASLLTQLLPNEAECWGLFSLMLHAEARKDARRDNGVYIPLSNHNTARWDKQMIAHGEAALARAWRLGQPGPYQIEAAIQSAHAAARMHDRDVTDEIVILYQQLVEIAPTIGAYVGYAGALAVAARAEEALHILDTLETARVENYQAYWAVRAHILEQRGRTGDALGAYERAIGLAQDEAARQFLMQKKTALGLRCT